jgi:hypothetical protein
MNPRDEHLSLPLRLVFVGLFFLTSEAHRTFSVSNSYGVLRATTASL